MDKLIITAAICGAEVMKEHNVFVPYTIKELTREAKEVVNAGASIIHLHVREDDGTPTQAVSRFNEAMKAIKKVCPDVIIQPSTGGAVGMSDDERLSPIKLNPEMCTLDCGSVNFGEDETFINSKKQIKYFAKKIYNKQIKPELECFGKMHVDQVLRLHKGGHIKDPMHFSFVLGVDGGQTGLERDFFFLKDSIPSTATYSVAGIGKYEFPLAELAIKHGGHVRVGLEDNIYIEKHKKAKGNKDLVKKVVKIAKKYNRKIASPNDARKILKLGEFI
ncbi:MAG: 3-keto-5-aminohexanoate cleavage protein [Candidatus Izimaplasma sp.]|nr:3-keto-5-aminohexanoate cleavage protein [Candidatus Izimaplasma bacterium]